MYVNSKTLETNKEWPSELLFSKLNQTFFGHFDLDNVFIDDDFSGYCDWPSVLLFSKLDMCLIFVCMSSVGPRPLCELCTI